MIVGDADDGGGIPQGDLLAAFAEAVIGDDDNALANARAAVIDVLGAEALVDASAVASMFNAIDRVADSTGAPLEADKEEMSAALRAEIGIDVFAANKEALEDTGTKPAAE